MVSGRPSRAPRARAATLRPNRPAPGILRASHAGGRPASTGGLGLPGIDHRNPGLWGGWGLHQRPNQGGNTGGALDRGGNQLAGIWAVQQPEERRRHGQHDRRHHDRDLPTSRHTHSPPPRSRRTRALSSMDELQLLAQDASAQPPGPRSRWNSPSQRRPAQVAGFRTAPLPLCLHRRKLRLLPVPGWGRLVIQRGPRAGHGGRSEVETGVHVEIGLSVRADMGPEERGRSAPVGGREELCPLRFTEDVLEHEGVDVDRFLGLPQRRRRVLALRTATVGSGVVVLVGAAWPPEPPAARWSPPSAVRRSAQSATPRAPAGQPPRSGRTGPAWAVPCSPCGNVAGSSTRTCSGLRSLCATCSAGYAVSFSASATLHSRKPRCSRTYARWYSTVRPVQS